MVEQDSLYHKPEARAEREEEQSVHTPSESVPLDLDPSHLSLALVPSSSLYHPLNMPPWAPGLGKWSQTIADGREG